MEICNSRKSEKTSFLLKIVIVLALFVNEDILVFGTLGDAYLIGFRYFVQFALFVVLMLRAIMLDRIKIDRASWFLFMMALLLMCSLIINADFRNGYFVLILILSISFLLLKVASFNAIMDVFFNVMTFISFYSLVVFAITKIDSSWLSSFPIIKNIADNEFYFVLFTNVPLNHGGLLRNYGPFREPGVFQMFIIIALIYGLFIKKQKSLPKIMANFLAIITTFSTTGYIVAGIVVLALLFDFEKENRKVKYTTILVLFCIILYMALFTDLLYREDYGSVFGKLWNRDSLSFNARWGSVILNLRMFKQAPFFGKGITYVDTNFPLWAFEEFEYYINDNTNTLLIQLSMFGILYVLMYLIGFVITVFYNYRTNIFCKLLILASLLVMLVGENLTYSILLSVFIFAGVVEWSARIPYYGFYC